MKNTFIFILTLCYINAVLYAQNVGIGTTTPLEKLSVLTNYGYGISHEANAIKLSTYIDAGGAYLGTLSNHPLHFFTGNGAAQVSLSTEGFLGIGLSFPQYRLDVSGRMRIRTGTIGNIFTTSGVFLDDYRDGSTRIFLGMQDSIRFGIYGDGNPGVAWGFNFNARNGNVGIGRIANSSKLEIGGAYPEISLYHNNNFSGAVRGTDTSTEISAKNGELLTSIPASDLIIQPTTFLFPFLFPGNVGISVNSPQAKLHVGGNTMIGNGNPAAGYMLSVNGKIICTETKVTSVVNWPDYVFKKDYKLLPLSELESEIKHLGHLPNIPSAAEIEKQGIELGDMVKRLMVKIEELTLYVIELKKENEKLKSKLFSDDLIMKQ